MRHLITNSLLAVLTFAPGLAFAHPGHDHNSAWAPLVHLAWIAPLITLAVLLIRQYQKESQTKISSEEGKA